MRSFQLWQSRSSASRIIASPAARVSAARRARIPYRRFDEMRGAVTKRHTIKGIFARGETSAWIAPPGGMKSALMASAAIAVASGADWFGKRNKEACAVVIFALERADLVQRRIEAHSARSGLTELPIVIVSATIDLMRFETVAKVVSTIREVEADYGRRVGLVIFDTFAKLIAAGGGDETQKDQGAVFANVQRVKNETDVHVALVGHSGKDVSRGARGSNAILGDVDMMVEISGDIVRTATVTKANDSQQPELMAPFHVTHAGKICGGAQ
jgi:RecA-family ATPase